MITTRATGGRYSSSGWTPATAKLLSAPTMLAAAALVVFLTVRSVLAVSGVRPLEE